MNIVNFFNYVEFKKELGRRVEFIIVREYINML